jgi:hypothetical protein
MEDEDGELKAVPPEKVAHDGLGHIVASQPRIPGQRQPVEDENKWAPKPEETLPGEYFLG